MFALSGHLQFYLYRHPTDMRKSFEGLSGIVRSQLDRDPLCGDVYVFLNRRRDRIKLLVWDRSGFWIFYKRLEQGTFQLPGTGDRERSVALSYEQLLLILEGIDLCSVKRRRRYHRQIKVA